MARQEMPENAKESLGFLAAAREAVQEAAPGLNLGKILTDVGSELGRMGVQGQAEMAAALFSGSDGYVPYGRGQNPAEKESVEPQKDEPQQEHGGREM